MKIGIVGSRRRNTEADKELVRQALKKLIEKGLVSQLVSGGCRKGADSFVESLNREFGLPEPLIFYPKKEDMKSNTKFEYARICYERNTLIALHSDILIAVVAADRTGGTEDTLRKFIKLKGREKAIIITVKI